jgi:hypothetical protein
MPHALPAVLFAVAAGAVPFERWATRRRLLAAAVALGYVLMVAMSCGCLRPCSGRQPGQSEITASSSGPAASALVFRPIHQNSTPMQMKISTGISSVHR